MFLITVFMK